MDTNKQCTYCGQVGHQAYACPWAKAERERSRQITINNLKRVLKQDARNHALRMVGVLGIYPC